MDAVFLDPNPSSFALELRVIDPLEDLLGSYFYLFPTFPDGFFTPWEEKRPLFFLSGTPILSGKEPKKSSLKVKRGRKKGFDCRKFSWDPRKVYTFASLFRRNSRRAFPTEFFF